MKFWRRLRVALGARHQDELKEELEFHREMLEREGEPRKRLGNELLLRERSRDEWGWTWIAALARDCRYAARRLRHAPGYTLTAVAILALAIGANTAIFSVVDAAALRSLPGRNPERLQMLEWTSRKWSPPGDWGTSGYVLPGGGSVETSFSYPLLQRMQRESHTLDGLCGFQVLHSVDATVDGRAELAGASLVDGHFDSVLGLTPAVGRSIGPDDVQSGAPMVAELSYEYWQRRFGGEFTILNRTIEIDGVPATVIGVDAEGFQGMDSAGRTDVFLPITALQSEIGQRMFSHTPPSTTDDNVWWVRSVARLKPGASASQATAELNVIFLRTAASFPQDASVGSDRPSFMLAPAEYLDRTGLHDALTPGLIAMALVGVVLLLACANLANLGLAQMATRRSEIALRISLGAGHAVVLRQLLMEDLLRALLGAACSIPLGLACGVWMSSAFGGREMHLSFQLNAHLLEATAGLAIVAALLSGLAPALRYARMDPQAGLKAAAHRTPGGEPLSRVLLGVQMAICLLVLCCAGIFARTLLNLETVQTGFDANNLTLFSVEPKLAGYTGPRLQTVDDQLLGRVRAVPGVENATELMVIPGASNSFSNHSIALRPDTKDANKPRTSLNEVSPGYFATYRIRLLAGRDFQQSDTLTAPAVAIVNEAMAARFTGSPIGQLLYVGSGKDQTTLRVVGLAADSSYQGVRDPSPPTVYTPTQQDPGIGGLTYAVRSTLPLGALRPLIEGAVHSVDPQLPVYQFMSQREYMEQSYQPQVVLATTSAAFGGLALLLAAVGLYGLTACAVARRTREIGVRLALGARPRQVVATMVRSSVGPVAIGAAVGLPLALAAAETVKSMLFGVAPTDLTALGGAALVLLATSGVAAWLPARHAARVDPNQALRSE